MVSEIQNKAIKYRKKRICRLVTIVLIFTVSMPVMGKVILEVTNRMSKMQEEEKEFYNDIIQGYEVSAFSYSRELTEYEEQRMDELTFEYVNKEAYPQNSITILNGEKIETIENVTYCKENGIIYLPNTELEDEDILQILDFYAKSDYSLRDKNKEIEASVEAPEINESIEESLLTELKEFFEVEIGKEQLKVDNSMDENQLYFYVSDINSPVSDFENWMVIADKLTGTPIVMEASDTNNKMKEMLSISIFNKEEQQELIQRLNNKGKEILNRMGEDTTDMEVSYITYHGDDEVNLTKIIRFYYKHSENGIYHINFIVETEQVCFMNHIKENNDDFMTMTIAKAKQQVKRDEELRYEFLHIE